MTTRRLRDIPQIAELERAALLDPSLQSLNGQWDDDRFDKASKDIFGVTQDDTYPDIDDLEGMSDAEARQVLEDRERVFVPLSQHPRDQVEYFAGLGWDVTDDYGQPLRVLDAFSRQLLAAIRGVVGHLPQVTPEAWGKSLAGDASKFKRR